MSALHEERDRLQEALRDLVLALEAVGIPLTSRAGGKSILFESYRRAQELLPGNYTNLYTEVDGD